MANPSENAAGRGFREREEENLGADLLDVRREELCLILSKREAIGTGDGHSHHDLSKAITEDDFNNEVWSKSLVGLAFSGGGIRSATFNLGILQSLAKHRLLRRVDYLSTVSGGGYIGGWLISLLHREDYRLEVEDWPPVPDNIKQGRRAGGSIKKMAIDVVEERLNPHQAARSKANIPEDPAISHLRTNSNYLSPKLGVLSADTWSLVATYLRNVILNQAILILTIGGLMLLPLLAETLIHKFWNMDSRPLWAMKVLPIGAIVALGGVAAWNIGRNVAAVADTDPAKPNPVGTGPLFVLALGPLLLVALLLTFYLPSLELLIGGSTTTADTESSRATDVYAYLLFTATAVLAYLVFWVIAMISAAIAFSSGWLPMDNWTIWLSRWRAIVGWAGCSAAILGLSLYGIFQLIDRDKPDLAIWLAPPLILLALVLTEMTHIGLSSIAFKSQQREWLARFSAWMMILAFGWLVFAGIVFYGPAIVKWAFQGDYLGQLITSGWVGTTIAGLFAGRGTKEDEKPGWIRTSIIVITPYLFIAGLFVFIAAGVDFLLDRLSTTAFFNGAKNGPGTAAITLDLLSPVVSFHGATKMSGGEVYPWPVLLGGLIVTAFLVWIFARRFDINEFSLHHMYGNRLTRCYLGATTGCRFENPFTGFSPQDDLPFWVKKAERQGAYRLGSSEQELDELPFPRVTSDGEDEKNSETFGLEKAMRAIGKAPAALDKAFSTIVRKNKSETAKQREKYARDLAGAYPGPYPLINTAINLVGGTRLAWQERKAASFTLSPLYCGFRLPQRASDDERCRDDEHALGTECNYCIRRFLDDMERMGHETGGLKCPFHEDRTVQVCLEKGHKLPKDKESIRGFDFRPTREFSSEPHPLTLGDAIATSGAAASPNMGYHTTPAFAFLLALFNIRLGRWVGNPWTAEWETSGPKFALRYFFSEALGLTNEKSNFVYLSDGGHFDNLGIYELVRRHCRYIIACDVGADPEYTFEDLANTTRKCRIDLGVEIEIDVSEIRHQDEHRNNAAQCALGYVRYPNDDNGTLLYIKAARPVDIPTDILQYATEQVAYPHETTVDQFFSESQFESYRRLGLHIGNNCLARSVEKATSADTVRGGKARNVSMARLFRDLRQRWYKRSSSIEANFTRLAAGVDAVFKQLGTREELAFLDKQFYPEWRVLPTASSGHGPDVAETSAESTAACSRDAGDDAPDATEGLMVLPKDPKEFRAGFYFCNRLIQLAENVYLDLELDNEYDHPDNAGWMNLFRHWSWSGMFRVTWAISAATYGRRFLAFCERHLDLTIGDVETRLIESDVCNRIQNNPDAVPDEYTVNILERRQLAYVLKRRKHCNVYQLDLAVRVPEVMQQDPADKPQPLLKFNFGYAVVADEALIMLRVQDHLRRMELGRRALRQLFVQHPKLGMDVLPDEATIAGHLLRRELLDALGEAGLARHVDRFKTMFDEVSAEAATVDGKEPSRES